MGGRLIRKLSIFITDLEFNKDKAKSSSVRQLHSPVLQTPILDPPPDMLRWVPEEDLYGLSYPEMQYWVHWCPFGELSQACSFEELEPVATTYHNEFHGHHATVVNQSYLAYVGPGPSASPRISDTTTTQMTISGTVTLMAIFTSSLLLPSIIIIIIIFSTQCSCD